MEFFLGLKTKKIAFLGLAFATTSLADKYEVESATLTGGSGFVNSNDVSGTGYTT
jgi:hypothetical protein